MHAIKATHCQECTRPISLHFPGQMPICTECARRLQALTEANAAEDAASRAACLEYAEMQKLAAWRLGGYFAGLIPLDITPIRAPAYMSERAPDNSQDKRARGRPAKHPADKLEKIPMRIPRAMLDKLELLGRDWLMQQIANAEIK